MIRGELAVQIIIIIALKGAIRDFFTISALRREPSPTRTVGSSGPDTIVCKSRATSSAYHVQQAVIRATWYEGTAELLSLTEFKSHLFELCFIG